MSITEVKGRPGWYNVRVYDRVRAPGDKPKPFDRRVKGLTNARNVERELKNQRDRGSLAGRNTTLSDYADAYLRSRRTEVSAQTLDGYTANVDRYIKRHPIGAVRLGSLTVTMVADFYADLLTGENRDTKGEDDTAARAAPIAVESVRSVHRVLSMILKRATVDGFMNSNPCQVAKPPKDDEPDELGDAGEQGLDPADARRLLAALQDLGELGETNVYNAAALALGTGLRRSEFLALRWSDVDLTAKELRVTGKLEQVKGIVRRRTTKTKRSRRTVPFSDKVSAVLRAQKALNAQAKLDYQKQRLWVDEGWVFPSLTPSLSKDGETLPAGRCWTPNAFSQAWRRAMRTANEILLARHVAGGGAAEDFEPLSAGVHSLRHTYATTQLRAGTRDEVVSRRLGHSSSLITRRVYSHATQEEAREGVAATDALL